MSDASGTPPMSPALSPAEWASAYISPELEIHFKTPGLDGSKRLHVNVKAFPLGGTTGDPRDLHALAATALYGTAFGFTHADVEALRWVGEWLSGTPVAAPTRGEGERLLSVAARLGALLPPQPPADTSPTSVPAVPS